MTRGDIEITVVALLEDKIRLAIVPGHYKKAQAVERARQEDPSLPEGGRYEAWVEIFNPGASQSTAAQLMEKAKGLRFLIFKY